MSSSLLSLPVRDCLSGANLDFTLNHTTVGILGESAAAHYWRQIGYNVRKPESRMSGDLQAITKKYGQIYNVEVKTSRRGKDGRFQFCLYRKVGDRVCTDHRHADYVMLIAVENDLTYKALVIPSDKLAIKMVAFRNVEDCKYKQYLAQ